MKPQFFRSEDRQLLGIYHRARGHEHAAPRAAVICPPIGHEYIRTHWCLRLLAGQLARRGLHVLRFDYTGIGDSNGTVSEVQSFDTWQSDIDSAMRHLSEQCNADSVMLVGLRFGASLASRVAAFSDKVNSLLLWEPIHSGSVYLDQLRSLHDEMLDLWVCKMTTDNNAEQEELLGSQYSRSLVNALNEMRITLDQIQQPHAVFDGQLKRPLYERNSNPMRKVEFTHDECSWNDLKQLETAWLRPQTTSRIVDQVVDTFDRLQRFGVLQNKVSVLRNVHV